MVIVHSCVVSLLRSVQEMSCQCIIDVIFLSVIHNPVIKEDIVKSELPFYSITLMTCLEMIFYFLEN